MSDTFGDEAEHTISIDEYINQIDNEELEADLVLGGDAGDECTYAKGYMKRQAIFSCLTCTPDGNAGICTACCLACHDGHEVLELWTRRNFKCDCGNSKFGVFCCKLLPSKDIENTENLYNHNYKGLYCTCNRPYPDPDVEVQEDMIQCCLCEDWFHEEHLGLNSSYKIPRDGEGEPMYEDFICQLCSPLCSFLVLYPETIWAPEGELVPNADTAEKDEPIDIGTECGPGKPEKDICSLSSLQKGKGKANGDSESIGVGESSVKTIGSIASENMCVLLVSQTVVSSEFVSKPLFLSKNWREILCRCVNCLDMYKKKNISFLLVKEDTIAEYEKMAKQKRQEKLQEQEGAALNFFDNLGHVEKMEILSGIQDFKSEFRGLLESAGPSKTITADDISQMFENLKNKRRRV